MGQSQVSLSKSESSDSHFLDNGRIQATLANNQDENQRLRSNSN